MNIISFALKLQIYKSRNIKFRKRMDKTAYRATFSKKNLTMYLKLLLTCLAKKVRFVFSFLNKY